MKKLFLISGMLFMTLFMSNCTTGYVKDRPYHQDGIRPVSPGYNYVWLEGNWKYNRRNHSYTRQNGAWSKPRYNKNYRNGEWRTTEKGNYWVSGRWNNNSNRPRR